MFEVPGSEPMWLSLGPRIDGRVYMSRQLRFGQTTALQLAAQYERVTREDKITIFHLLTHTSGIPSFTGFPDYRSTEAFPTTTEKLVARFRDKPLEFVPGDRMNYSNSGYVLLGYLIERISGESYASFVHKNIFTPLGMKDSGYD